MPDKAMPDKPDAADLPRDPASGEPLPQMHQPGYYPKYRTLTQEKFWDAATREVVRERVTQVPPIRFFTPDQLRIMTAVCDQVLPQDDRLPQFRIPIVNSIDERLWKDEITGYRFEDMPSDREAYRLGIKAIDLMAFETHGQSFADISRIDRDRILKSIHDGKPTGAHEIWARMSIRHFWALVVHDCATTYYSHPWAWDEVGYGGPAYPRAYTRLEGGLPEPWETDESRYEWIAPESSLSDFDEEQRH